MNLGDRKNRTAALRRFLAVGIAVTALGCASRPVTLGQTQIGQGRLYQSGSVTYDRFFQDTHAVQLQAMSAEEDEAGARAPLEKALEAKGATLDKLYELAVGRAKKGDEGPPLLICTVTGLEPVKDAGDGAKTDPPSKGSDSKKITVSVTGVDGGPAQGDLKGLAKAIGDSAKAEADIIEKFAPVSAKASQMVATADELSMSVDREFSARKTRKDVSQELAAAKLILDATSERSREVAQRARTFLKGLSEALKAPAVEAPPPPPPAPEKPTKPVRSRKGGGPRPGGASSAPPDSAPAKPAPSKPAKPAGEDFNP